MKKGLRNGLIIAASTILMGAVFVGCNFFGLGDGESVISENYSIGESAGSAGGYESSTYTVYNVDALCVVKTSDIKDIGVRYINNAIEGGGTVEKSGNIYKKQLSDGTYEYGHLELEPKALQGFEYVGMSWSKGGSSFTSTNKKVYLTIGNAPSTRISGTTYISNIGENFNIYFWFRKTSYQFTFSVAPSSGEITVSEDDFYEDQSKLPLKTTTSKISLDMPSSKKGYITVRLDDVDDSKYQINDWKGLLFIRDPVSGGVTQMEYPGLYDELQIDEIHSGADNCNIRFCFDRNPTRDYEIIFTLRSKKDKEQYLYKNQIITHAEPVDGGTTSGDIQNISPVSNNITATANSGYKFSYWSWYSNGKYMTSQESSFTASSSGVTVYTAHFIKATYKVELASVMPEGGGSVTGTGVYAKGENPKIRFRPSDGYKLSKWYYTNEKGVQYSGGAATDVGGGEYESEIGVITEDVYLHVEFESEKVKVRTVASPAVGGSASLRNPSDPLHDTEDDYVRGSEVKLSATPNSGYKFLYWSDDTGDQYTSSDLTIPSITKDTTFTAHYVLNSASVSVIATPAGAGQVRLNDSAYADHIDVNVSADDDLLLYARETSSKYHFDHWEVLETGKDNKIDKNNPMTVLDINTTGNIRYVAVFAPNLSTLSVRANPQEGGTVLINGAFTELSVEEGDAPILSATVNTGYYFDYWEDSKGNCFSGEVSYDSEGREVNTLKLTSVQADETYTAYFVPWSVRISYLTDPFGAGTIDCNGHGYESVGSQDELGGWQVTLTARANNPMEYRFDHWEDDFGNKYNSNPLELPEVRKDTKFTAVFAKYSKQDSGGIIVYASPASGGYVSKVYNDDGTVTINATPNKGYSFNCWKLGKTVISRKRETILTSYSDGDEYVAYFTSRSGEIVRTGIVDEHFYRSSRSMTSPVYTFDRNKLTFLASAQIELDSKIDDTPAQQYYAAYDNAAKYYEQHLIDDQFVFADGELVTTIGENMPITYIPADEEQFASDALEFTAKKFGDRYDTEIIAAVDVKMPAEYEDGTRTYLWRNTGGVYKDNIYLLYATNAASEYTWVTGVVDIDESIRFTVADPGSMVRLAAVRVKIEK